MSTPDGIEPAQGRVDFSTADPAQTLPLVASPEGGTYTVGDLVAAAEAMSDEQLLAHRSDDPDSYIAQYVESVRADLLDA